MASEGTDLGSLSTSQQEALQQYTNVTNQEVQEAIPLLERSQWNVQIAIAKFFDGEGPDPLAEAVASQEYARTEARHENLQQSLLESAGSPIVRPARTQTDQAPRIVAHQPVTTRPPWIVGLFFTPFRLGWSAITALFRTLLYALSFLPASLRPRLVTNRASPGFRDTSGRRMLVPRDTAARFRREFEEEYGPNRLPFYEGGLAQAHDLAKKELKFLLVVLISPEHDDTESFVKDTLLAPQIIDYLNDPANNIILWGGSMLDSEAYQVSVEYGCTKFPFTAIVCLTPKEGSTRMGIVRRLVGPMPAETYLSRLEDALEKYGEDLRGVRAERTAQEVVRNLRTEQDSAYERSLAIDRERARQKREAATAAEEAEKRAQQAELDAARLQESQRRWRSWRSALVAPEPPPNDKNVVRVALMMPEETGAGRITRRFPQSAPMDELYAFVDCYELLQGSESERGGSKPEAYEHTYPFRISSTLPRVVFEPSPVATMGEMIGKSGNLIVESDVLSESEDNDESTS